MTLDRLVPHLLLNYPFAPNASLPNGKVPNVLNKYETPLFAAFFKQKFKYYDGNRVLYRKSLIARACIIVLYQSN
ncbi:MAG: hypothetical protein ACLTW0_01415 [Alistipes ihumii]|jgi:hypothetical protein|uniref:hypothetical protein n=1 Tax=Alistipes ihumii TaxID=1470347 RepID=UPI002356ABCD|nr:hypothetical protein [Alistipes ihumii]